jgi:hypothetical protein
MDNVEYTMLGTQFHLTTSTGELMEMSSFSELISGVARVPSSWYANGVHCWISSTIECMWCR